MSNENDPLCKGSKIECTVEVLAFGGKGIARHDGMTVFIDHAVPGQRILCKITKLKKRFAEATRLEVLEKSEQEQVPFCQYFGTCGGCVHQDIRYENQLYWKGRQVSETLQRIGKVSTETTGMGEPAIGSPEEVSYRNKMEFSFSGTGETLRVGFKKRGSETEVLDISSCPLLPDECSSIPAMVREYCSASGIGAYVHGKGGYWRKLVVRVSRATGDIMVNIITSPGKKHDKIDQLGKMLYSKIKNLKSFIHSTRKGRADLATGEIVSISGESFITETLTRTDGTEINYRISPNSFFQTNSSGAEQLYRRSVEITSPQQGDVVYDLFCGSGGIGMFMAKDVHEVIGIEISKETVQSAKDNAALNRIGNARYMVGNLTRPEDFPNDLPKPDMVIVDPPRSGVPAHALDRLMDLAPDRILYISCNPGTLARDTENLNKKYKMESFSAVDMFPHTSHVECIALLTRAR